MNHSLFEASDIISLLKVRIKVWWLKIGARINNFDERNSQAILYIWGEPLPSLIKEAFEQAY